ncbi:MAG: YicC family protein, partial [Acidobacteria bacterium]|nr:YicC family protein [Acidobacteriota bacterium]
MLRSMTGYSRAQHDEPELTLAVSVKSINHRFLDLQLRIPAGLDAVEPLLRSLVKEHIARGHVEVQVSVDRPGQTALGLDRKLLGAYLQAVQELRKECGYGSDPDLVALLRIPGVVT